MNITEIQTALAALVVQMTEKGVVTPSADFSISDGGNFTVYLRAKYGSGTLGIVGDGKFLRGIDPSDAFAEARRFIAALPSQKETQTREYLKRVANAIDYAAEKGIADEYVTPLRGVTCAMTENLLTDQRAKQ